MIFLLVDDVGIREIMTRVDKKSLAMVLKGHNRRIAKQILLKYVESKNRRNDEKKKWTLWDKSR